MKTNKELMHKLQENDGTWFYTVKEVQDQSGAWQSRQAEVDEKDKRIEAALKEIFHCCVIGIDRIYTCDAIKKALRGDDDINVTC